MLLWGAKWLPLASSARWALTLSAFWVGSSGWELSLHAQLIGVCSVLCSRELGPLPPPVSEAEFEEIMNRNRAISSSAISKAVSGASAGNSSPLQPVVLHSLPSPFPHPSPHLLQGITVMP